VFGNYTKEWTMVKINESCTRPEDISFIEQSSVFWWCLVWDAKHEEGQLFNHVRSNSIFIQTGSS